MSIKLKFPPRKVPFLLKTLNLFGGTTSLIGWIFLVVGLIVNSILIPAIDFKAYVDFSGDLRKITGEVTRVEMTNTEINERTLMAYHYSFQDSDGIEFNGVSYSTDELEPGEQVPIEYPKDHPNRSRIVGMGTSSIPIYFLVFLIFPIIGFIFAFIGLKKGLRANVLLVHGKEALGKLRSSTPTNMTVNDRPVLKLTFAFTADDGKEYEAVEKTHTPEILEDEKEELLLYHPNNPSYAVMFDSLPGNAVIDNQGNLKTSSPVKALASMILPCISVFIFLIIILLIIS